ncbi:hypothetical protein CW304_18860 [Bacillus sp. UFRGS-B20]|nr:hypothetical protein CW304_18860 [Bacillus sp. UFRGS-B20]
MPSTINEPHIRHYGNLLNYLKKERINNVIRKILKALEKLERIISTKEQVEIGNFCVIILYLLAAGDIEFLYVEQF